MTTEPSDECKEALARGDRLVGEEGLGSEELVLTAATRILARPGTWRLTYKPRRLVPDTADTEVGAGGEVFVEIDMGTGAARVTGRGE